MTVQAQILALLARARATSCDCAFVFVTHDLGVASQLADRIAVMYGGRLAEFGTSESVLDATRASVHCRPARVAAHAARPIASTNSRRCRANRPTRVRTRRAARSRPGARCAKTSASEAPPALRPAGTHDGIAACIQLGEQRRISMTIAAPEWPRQETTLADYGNPSGSALVVKGVDEVVHAARRTAPAQAAGSARRRPRSRARRLGRARRRDPAAASRPCCASSRA